MYIPPSFHEQELPSLRAVLRAYPFGMLVSSLDGLPFATHLPMMLQTRGDRDVLIGHVAKANAHVQAFDGETESMAVFTGPHAYVSPRWMAAPAVPTWNYVAVHAYGTPSRIDDPDRARAGLAALSEVHEQGRWSIGDLPADYTARMLNALVVFEMPVDLWRGKVKMSQNKQPAERARIAAELRAGGAQDVADVMELGLASDA